jgi:hypothetical protein
LIVVLQKTATRVLAALLVIASINYYLRLGIWGLVDGKAKGVMLGALGLGLVYWWVVLLLKSKHASRDEKHK